MPSLPVIRPPTDGVDQCPARRHHENGRRKRRPSSPRGRRSSTRSRSRALPARHGQGSAPAGTGRILAVSIDDGLMVPGEKADLEDLIAAAINDARGKAEAASAEVDEPAMGGLPMPPASRCRSKLLFRTRLTMTSDRDVTSLRLPGVDAHASAPAASRALPRRPMPSRLRRRRRRSAPTGRVSPARPASSSRAASRSSSPSTGRSRTMARPAPTPARRRHGGADRASIERTEVQLGWTAYGRVRDRFGPGRRSSDDSVGDAFVGVRRSLYDKDGVPSRSRAASLSRSAAPRSAQATGARNCWSRSRSKRVRST
jgi:hypothetical protein